ncbi:MAG TPA: hypothetical protein VG405_06860, partial [Solirubrobacteraceae bacterium]|nr:hypothetical protein [Solirubrobacteraceae bacterium]
PPELAFVDRLPELAFVDPPPDLALVDPPPELALVDPPPELALVDPPFADASDPLLEAAAASAARVLRRAWACLAIRSPETLPLFSFRAVVARLTEAASAAAACAPRGLLAVVAIGSAEELSELLGLLPHGLDLAGQIAELLPGYADLLPDTADLVGHSAQVHLLGHGDAQDLALRLDFAAQQRPTDRTNCSAEHRHAEVGQDFVGVGTIGRLLVAVSV